MQQHQGLQPLGCAVGHDPAAVPRAEGEASLLKEKEKQPEVSQAGLMSATGKKGLSVLGLPCSSACSTSDTQRDFRGSLNKNRHHASVG